MTRFASVVIDVDSTLSQIEGIEWLSRRCNVAIQARITETTNAAMRGDVSLESVYGERLALVRPSRSDVFDLSNAYIAAMSPGAAAVIQELQTHDVRVVLVSGGLREAILPMARTLNIPDADVCAVPIHFDANGAYAGYDTHAPLARHGGKPDVVRQLLLTHPILAVGDGMTDVDLLTVVDCFVAFVGVVRHEPVVARANHVVKTFADLLPLVLP